MNTQILVGADPELFAKMGGKFVSAHGMIRGTKRKPFLVRDGAVQVDGMALEFNIDPASNSKEFISNIESVLGQLADMVPGAELCMEAVAEFDEEYMNSQPAVARELGCDPDFNAYTMLKNNPPNGKVNFRTAAGHVHVGWGQFSMEDDRHFADCAALSKQMDVLLGVPSVLFDDCAKRRELYGKAGAFRPKPYGVEYRVLSNKWLQSKNLMAFVYDRAVESIERCIRGDLVYERVRDAEDVINTSNKKRAEEICTELGIAVQV
jgi:hypothetical protein